VSFLDPPDVREDPITSLFGTSISFAPNVLSQDTLVSISTSFESVPALPISFNYAMPVAEISLEQGQLDGKATITLPVLASYGVERARVFHLVKNDWKEIDLSGQKNYGESFLHQQVDFEVNSLSTFVLVIELPFVDSGDTGGGGGCHLGRGRGPSNVSGISLDPWLIFLPVLYLIARRRVSAQDLS
jgi:hypothetical protein